MPGAFPPPGSCPGKECFTSGAVSGYYSAILSELVSSSGAVDAWDVEASLVDAARRNLRQWKNALVDLRSGTAPPFPESDIIYVCAGCTQPLLGWVSALSDGGRLLFPLTPGWDTGAALREAFAARDMERVSELKFGDGRGRDDAWLVGHGWWLMASQTSR